MSAISAPWSTLTLGGKRTRIVDSEGRWVCDCRSEEAARHVTDCVNAAHTVSERSLKASEDYWRNREVL